MKTTIKTGFAALVLLLAISCKKENTIIQPSAVNDMSSNETELSDVDGFVTASSVTIGTQRWMTKNLNVSRYRNGDKIPQVKDSLAWQSLTTGAWCYYKNDRANGAAYGKLYNWYAVHDPRGLAPVGWHIPSDAEFTTLSTFLGGDAVAGGKMKEAGTAHWFPPNTDATNSSGFTGLPGGYRNEYAIFGKDGIYNYWWSATEYNSIYAWNRYLYYGSGALTNSFERKTRGLSVRCIKD